MCSVIDALEKEGIDYLLVSGLAVVFHGIARSTVDADFVVRLGTKKLTDVMRELGPGYELDPQQAFEARTGKSYRHIQVLGTAFTIELFLMGDDAFEREQFDRRWIVPIGHRQVAIQSPEDVIVQKLRWHRHQDLADAGKLIALQGKSLDWSYIERWCGVFGTTGVLAQMRGPTSAD
jgi:hypothetical protein